MAKMYVLVGVPGSGKSTWVKSQDWAAECAYISTDGFVDEYAASVNKTYSEVFDEYMPTAISLMVDAVAQAVAQGKDIIWDQTSTTVKSRRNKFRSVPGYDAIAVVFETPPTDELNKRLASRPGKDIPDYVMRSMISGFQYPTLEEGFSEIWNAV